VVRPPPFDPAPFESLGDAVLVISPGGGLRYANRAAYALLGYEREALLGLPVTELTPPDAPPLTREGRVVTLLCTCGGERVRCEARVSRVPGGDLVAVCRDLGAPGDPPDYLGALAALQRAALEETPQAFLERAARALGEVVEVPLAGVFVAEGRGLRLRAGVGFPGEVRLEGDEREALGRYGVRSVLSAPLPGPVAGRLGAFDRVPRTFSGDARGFVDGIGALVALALSKEEQETTLQLLHRSLRTAPDSVLITEAQLEPPGPRIVYVNGAFTALTGYAPEEVIGKTPRLLQGPETDRRLLDELKRSLAAEGTFSGETVNYRKDGTPFRMAWRVAALRDEAGAPRYWVAVQRDVTAERGREAALERSREVLEGWVQRRTRELSEANARLEREVRERRRTEEALRDAEARFRTIFASGPQATCITTFKEGRIVDVNVRFEHILGYRREEVLGRTVFQIGLWAHPEKRRELLRTVAARGYAKDVEVEARHRSGEGRTLLASFEKLTLGGEDHVLSMFEDVTERAKLEAELRTSRLKLAQAREGERVQLARELHDGAVQTLIGISYGLAEARRALLKGGLEALGGELEAHRKGLLEVARGLRFLIAQLRPAGLGEFGLGASLQHYVNHLQGAAPGPRFHLALPPPVPLPDEVQLCLFRVAQEALRNAVKHADAANVWLSLEVTSAEVRLEVRDDGVGAELPKNLGSLAAANHFGLVGIAEQVAGLGGELTLHAAPGRGLHLRVRLPLPGRGEGGT